MADQRQAPDDLVEVGPSGYIPLHQAEPVEQDGQQVQSGRPADLVAVDPDYVARQVDPINPVTESIAGGAAARPAIKKVLGMDEHTGRQSLETYLKSQLHHKYPGLNLDALEKEIQKIHGPQARVATMHEVQAAIDALQGPVFGQPTVDLSGYTKGAIAPKTRAGQAEALIKNFGEHINPITGQGFGAKTMRTAGRGALGAAAGYQGAQAWNRAQEGDIPGALISGTGAVGSGLMTSRNPKAKGSGAVLQGLSILGQGIHDAPEEKAKGGLIHLKKGGEPTPEFGEARAYEPSYNEQIGDYVAPYIGRQQADALFGGPRAQTVDKLNPLSWLAQTPGSVAQTGKDFYDSAKEGDYLGAMGSYALGAMDVAPMLNKGKRLAQLMKLQGFGAGVDVASPYIEKGAHAAAPYVGKAAKFIKKYLPQGQYEGVMASSKLPGYANGKTVLGKKIASKMSPELDLGKVLPNAGYRALPEQTVTNPLRNEFPGIYKAPDVIAREAAARVAPEDPMLKRLFGVNRDDLFEMSKRQGNEPGFIPGASKNPKGSAAAESVMNPRNTQRLLDVLGEVKTSSPDLYKGMHGWYTMDPQYHRMVELMGEDKAKQMYHRLNTFGGIESPNLPVPVEFNRASAANWLAEQDRMPDWVKYGGLRDKHLVEGMPEDIMGVPGRVGHQRASTSQNKFMETGEHGMISPKAPPYIQASSVPELGFQTDLPVGDAHWSRFIGLPDVRTGKEVSASVSTPELQQLAPWWKNEIAAPLGLESVPAQAILWGAGSPQTGVKTAIGAGKLELQAIEIAKAAARMGVSPETARDMILMGKARAGKKAGGLV